MGERPGVRGDNNAGNSAAWLLGKSVEYGTAKSAPFKIYEAILPSDEQHPCFTKQIGSERASCVLGESYDPSSHPKEASS